MAFYLVFHHRPLMTNDSPLLIQKLRLQRGWSQEQLAELTGLSVRTIQRVERGQTPTAESLKAIAAVLEVDFSALREAHMTLSANQSVRADEALALARVRKIKEFYMHAIEYVLIIGFLTLLNIFVHPDSPWALWAAIPWGLYLALDGLKAFDKLPFLKVEWEKRAVEKYLGRKL